MSSSTDQLQFTLSKRLKVSHEQVRDVILRLDKGESIPYLATFCADHTGGLSYEQLVQVRDAVQQERELDERKAGVLKSIEDQKALSDELKTKISSVTTIQLVDDLFLPFKRKKDTRRTNRYPASLQPLVAAAIEGTLTGDSLNEKAAELVDADAGLNTAEEVLAGVWELVAEQFAHNVEARQLVRETLAEHGVIKSKEFVEAESDQEEAKVAEEAAADTKVDSDAKVDSDSNAGADSSAEESVKESEPGESTDASSESTSDATATGEEGKKATEVATPVSAEAEPAETGPTESVESAKSSDAKADTEAAGTAAVVSPAPKKAAVKLPAGTVTAEQRRKQRRDARRRKRDQLRSSFKGYFGFSSKLSEVASHQMLALDRGERFRILNVELATEEKPLLDKCQEILVKTDHPNREQLGKCVGQSLKRYLLPSLEREVRRKATDVAEENSIRVSARNLQSQLMQPPIQRRVLSIDPGLKYGCKVVALDQHGNALADTTVHAIGDADRVSEGRRRMLALIDEHKLEVVAIGDGTGCRQAETTVSTMLEEVPDKKLSYAIVNEGGTNAYSISPLANQELPDVDPRLRAAISIGRRLQNPLSEMVKVDPAHISLGEARNDVKTKSLQRYLTDAVSQSVNQVPVDLNSATASLLAQVSGMTDDAAGSILAHREENGPFSNREGLKQVSGFDETAFAQSAPFLYIFDGENPLDATNVHPEDYEFATKILDSAGLKIEELKSETRRLFETRQQIELQPRIIAPAPATASSGDAATKAPESEASAASPTAGASADSQWRSRLEKLDAEPLLASLGISKSKCDQILAALVRPGFDIRYESQPPIFRSSLTRLETLQPNTELLGTVLNVVEFGAFVDIGLRESGLIHISQLADRFIRDPNELVNVGDRIRVWVVSVDQQKRRVSLTAVEPGKERPPAQRKSAPKRKPRRSSEQAKSRGKGGRSSQRVERSQSTRRRPKTPAKPITDSMKEGKEPMRTFGDLAQFYDGARTKTKDGSKKSKDSQDKGKE